MVNNVIGVVNYVIAARPSLRNFMIADIPAHPARPGARGQLHQHPPPREPGYFWTEVAAKACR
jgi:hypothetical protein